MLGKGIQLDDYDLKITVERDIDGKITSGLNIGDTTAQNQALILYAQPGEIKEQPIIGVGITSMCLDHDSLAWRSKIREQLELDGQKVDQVKITKTGIIIDAKY